MKSSTIAFIVSSLAVQACSGPDSSLPDSDISEPQTAFISQGKVYPGGWGDDDNQFFATHHQDDTWRVIQIDLITGEMETLDIPHGNVGVSDVSGPELLLEIVGDGGVAIYNINDGSSDTIIKTSDNVWHPSFGSSDIVFFDSDQGGELNIHRFDRKTRERVKLTNNPASEQGAKLSPDGSKIAFHRHMGDDNYDLVILDLASQSESIVTNSLADDSYPQWTPNETSIIFSSNRSGNFDLYQLCLANNKISPLVNTEQDEKYPRVSNRGDKIAYQVNQAGTSEIKITTLTYSGDCPA